jgi:hypothetical protein
MTMEKDAENVTVSLTPWEREKLAFFAVSNALTYATHDARGGLFETEKKEMVRWKNLSDKLSKKKEDTDEPS